MKNRAPQIDADQLGFDALLAETDSLNAEAALERDFGHLPSTIEAAVPYLCDLIARHHIAMLDGDMEHVLALREEANGLALRLNKGAPGILAGPDAPGCKLAELTKAPAGQIPAWGQKGSFTVEVCDMRVQVEIDGVYGIGARYMPWPGFSANAIDWQKPFLSETGYRSFLGIHANLVRGLTVDAFVRQVIEAHIRSGLRGGLVRIKPEYHRVQ